MLIDFTVENYRSIKEPVTLSAVAHSHGANEQDNKIAQPFSYPARKLEILPVLGIFGANASGKSNVINALGELLSYTFFNHSSKSGYNELSFIVPFKLGPNSIDLPSKFKLRLLCEGNIFIFELDLTRRRILKEKLNYIPVGSKRAVSRLLFERSWNEDLKKYIVKNGHDFGEAYKEIQLSLKESQTFLSLVIRNLTINVLEPLVSWLSSYWGRVSLDNDVFDYDMACFLMQETRPHLKDKVEMILQKFDTGIQNVEVEDRRDSGEDSLDFEVWITHSIAGKKTRWPLKEESLGTQKLFNLAAKLFYTFDEGGIMLVDELGFGTHPRINHEIVRLFLDRNINSKGAQLVFTSHDTTLLTRGLLRRDQIWFTQKRVDASTELYSLSDFGVRNDLVIDKAYLDGRFGAVPFLPDKEELTELLGV